MFKRLLKTTAVALFCAAPLSATLAEARQLRVSSFEPAQGFYSSKIIQPWMDKVNAKLSGGVEFKLYPGSILGAPPAQADLVKAGVADMALVVPTYTPGVFPLSGVVEIPGIVKNGAMGADILNTLLEDGSLAAEYSNYKVIALFTTPAYRFFVSGDPVTQPSELSGLKLRSPSKFGSELFAMVGASGVGLPAPQVYEGLERGVVSGAVWVMDAYRTFRLNEVAPNITTTGFIATPMSILMNKNTYDSLSDENKAVIDEMSGRATAEWIASVIDTTDAEIETSFRKDGKVNFVDLDEADQAAWDEAFSGAAEAWVNGQPDAEVAATILRRAHETAGD
ncbi:MAG: TRAP transporter substrate-binding protein [Mesorhizobium sp.]|uniref:TRAP transporter substrate-binding protein n=1 Tax=Mesorhizobium sp. TaxID=1871066 RepID=UPI000FE5B8CC|nr:TRAP transporter substrate-binding protein [Mesorhizobium sp.]RWI57086.1 MAG: TRAP transporter substrate-binding protein [Mesorhizobium sp.]